MPIQPEVPTKALPAQLASTILEEKHMVSIIMYLTENDGCMKTDVYTDVARNSRMPEKLGMLEDAGLGASLQHYNPLIDEAVAREWKLPASWKLTAQMPFGSPECKPDEKTFLPLDGRLKMFE